MFSIIFGREMIKILLCSISLVLLLSSCSEVKEKEPLVISVDPWVGSAPFYYAHAKGWLAQINIQLILASSIGENMRIFDSGASDMFTSTQHEYFTKRKEGRSIDTDATKIFAEYTDEVFTANMARLKEYISASQKDDALALLKSIMDGLG
jgi:hypothetical protein